VPACQHMLQSSPQPRGHRALARPQRTGSQSARAAQPAPRQKPTRLLRAALWAREESPRRAAAEGRLRRRRPQCLPAPRGADSRHREPLQVRSGGPELALELEKDGYAFLDKNEKAFK